MPSERAATLPDRLLHAAAQRATLFANHVLRAEPAALERLKPHAGKRIAFTVSGVPSWWPAGPLHFVVSRAGLLEIDETGGDAAELSVELDLSDPLDTAAGWLGGERRALAIHGDAAFAGDADWLADNLRWDAEDDLQRLVGPLAAHRLAGAGRGLAAAARGALTSLASLRRR